MTMYADFRAIYFPYCLQKQKDGSWVILNREYKPVGFNTSEFITYEEFPVAVKLEGLTPKKANKLAYSGEMEGDRIYLYNDGCVPTRSKKNMDAYLEKLAILAKLRLKA